MHRRGNSEDEYPLTALRLSTLIVATLCTVTVAVSRAQGDGAPPAAEAETTPVAPRVVVVAVDAKTLARLGPWGRRYGTMHSKLIRRLDRAGVRGIGFDVILFEGPEFSSAVAAITHAAQAASAPVVIAANPEEREGSRIASDSILAKGSVTALRAVDLKQDGDRVSGEVLDVVLPAIEAGRRPLALELGLRAGAITEADVSELVENLTIGIEDGKPVRIDGIRAAGNPASVETVSYVDVLQSRVPGAKLEGALVLVGLADGRSDIHTHPTTREDVSGVYFHAFALRRALAVHEEKRERK
jgi:CHASE2 domain-containing sensor protein